MSTEDFPFVLDDFLASVVEALRLWGDARAITTLIQGDCDLRFINSDWGVNYWQPYVGLPGPLYFAMTEDDRRATESVIEEAGKPFLNGTTSDALNSVMIAPSVSKAIEGWREDAVRFIKGEGVTNQGRVRSDNIASHQHRGLLFRSKAEVTLFEAMTRAQLAVAPLPVFVRIGNNYNRLEPDFVVIYKGLTFVVEVDGDSFHKESPAEADRRLVPLTYEGVEVRRIRANELESERAADNVVRELIDFMAKRKAAR